MELKVLGEIDCVLKIDHWMVRHKFVVVDLDTQPIPGADFLMHHGMLIDLNKGRLVWIGGDVELQLPPEQRPYLLVLAEGIDVKGPAVLLVVQKEWSGSLQ